ncbi:MAG: hypothetical protein K8S99_00030 [Planctomycetes bacterium]|nr:hypothetical protein [Planctomycetota bacterium]
MMVVVRDVAGVILLVTVPYAVLAGVAWVWGRRRRYVLVATTVLFILWIGILLPLLGVEGESGPAQAATPIMGLLVLAASLLFSVHAMLTWWAGRTPAPSRQKVRRAMVALAAIETAVIAVALLAPLAVVPERMALDGRLKCAQYERFLVEAIDARTIDEYEKEKGALPADLKELAKHAGCASYIFCPVTSRPYVFELNQKTGKFTITCTTPGHGSTGN